MGSTTSPERWRGLSVVRGRLQYQPPSLWWRRPVLRLEPNGLAVVSRRGLTELLGWDSPGNKWRLVGVHGSRANRAGIRVSILPVAGGVWDQSFRTRDVWLPSSWSMPPLEELPALTSYLVATPEARPSLVDAARLGALIAEFKSRVWATPRPPSEPMLGDRLDMYVAVERALHDSQWRRFGGRPVRGERYPDAAAIGQQARVRLDRRVSERITDEALRSVVDRHIHIGAWPFDVLVP
jgi:hypothetical protein